MNTKKIFYNIILFYYFLYIFYFVRYICSFHCFYSAKQWWI